LEEFLQWSIDRYDAEHFLLVLWGHSYGLGFGRDHGDPLTLQELREALRKFGPNRQLDLLGANACAMSYAEAAYELRGAAEFLVASEITMPFSGWPYAAILQRLGARLKKANVDARELGEIIIDEFMRSFRQNGVALSLLELSKADFLPARVESLARALKDTLSSPQQSDLVVGAFLDSEHGDVRPLIDLHDLCLNLEQVRDKVVVDSARAFRKQLRSGSDGLIVVHQKDPDFEGLNGLGIFAPAVTSGADLVRLELEPEKYELLALVEQTGYTWSDLVYHDLAEAIKPMNEEIDDLVMRAGASSREERAGVGQLLLSAKRSFDKLEDAVRNAKETAIPMPRDRPSGRRRRESTTGTSPLFLRLLTAKQPTKDRSRKIRVLPAGASRDAVTISLRSIETALTATERTLRRVLTNRSLGLGAGEEIKPGFGDIKPGFGDIKPGFGDIKPGFGDVKPGFGDVKPGFGDIKPGFGDIKPGFGDIKPGFGGGISFTNDGFVLTGELVSVVDLFGVVAASLKGLEEGLARLEEDLLVPRSGANASADERRHRAAEDAARSFRDLEDRIAVARDTSFWVLRHPVQGLGPTAGDSSSPNRRHIAAVAGLNTRNLRLL
jgi:hypothetical protein